jgi:hypothetical protein
MSVVASTSVTLSRRSVLFCSVANNDLFISPFFGIVVIDDVTSLWNQIYSSHWVSQFFKNFGVQRSTSVERKLILDGQVGAWVMALMGAKMVL